MCGYVDKGEHPADCSVCGSLCTVVAAYLYFATTWTSDPKINEHVDSSGGV